MSQVASTTEAIPQRSRRRDLHLADRIFYRVVKGTAWGMMVLLLSMIVVIMTMAWPALKEFGLRFFVTNDWDTLGDSFGALALIYGTVMSSIVALVISVPVSVGVALFLNELAPRWLSKPVGFLVEMLAAIPSIVYGLWGLYVLAPFLRSEVQPFLSEAFGFLPLFEGPPLGVGMLCAGVVLAIMITPTIASVCREVFAAIPVAVREAALGLGATRWEMLRISVLRTSVSGVVGAVILGLGRAFGETMAVTMVIGNIEQIKLSLYEPAQTMASILANQYAEADSDLHLSALTARGFCLFVVSLVVNGSARFVVSKFEKRERGEV